MADMAFIPALLDHGEDPGNTELSRPQVHCTGR
jgi:hypothetical protein